MRAATSLRVFSQRSRSVKKHGRQPKPRSLFSPISARPYWARDITTTLDQVLDITPDDVDILANKAAIAQAEGDLQRASALLAPLRPVADLTQALETQVYQAILERHPAQIIPRLTEILAKPDPALGYLNGELRFWLG